MSNLPRLLMVTPIKPALSGNGLAMRAAMVLRALARHYSVSLLVVPMYSAPADRQMQPELSDLCETVQFRRGSFVRHEAGFSDSRQLAGSFDVVHVFRLASIPFARPWLESAGATHLDLDDIESVSRPRIAALYRERGHLREALAEDAAARGALEQEIDALITFDRVYVCSAEDVDMLPFCGSAEVRILPNVVDLPTSIVPFPSGNQPFTFLFVGNLGYFPNADGLNNFAASVLPFLRQSAPYPFRIQVIGNGASPALKNALSVPEINVVGSVPELVSWYGGANAVVVPVRAGGGTRIKVLEAFSYRRAVVSTSLGVEGIAAQHGIHALIADEPEEFAAACIRLMAQAALRDQLAERAFQLVTDSYSLASMVNAVAPHASRFQPR